MGNLNFNVEAPKEEELQSSYDDTPIPEGTYKVEVSQSEMRDNSAGTGQWLRLHFTILEGSQSNSEFVEFFNIEHQNPVAERIAKEELSRLCRAVGIDGTLDDSEDLHGAELLVDLKIEQGKDGVTRNRVKKYKPLPAAAAPVAQAPVEEAAQESGTPPWQK